LTRATLCGGKYILKIKGTSSSSPSPLSLSFLSFPHTIKANALPTLSHLDTSLHPRHPHPSVHRGLRVTHKLRYCYDYYDYYYYCAKTSHEKRVVTVKKSEVVVHTLRSARAQGFRGDPIYMKKEHHLSSLPLITSFFLYPIFTSSLSPLFSLLFLTTRCMELYCRVGKHDHAYGADNILFPYLLINIFLQIQGSHFRLRFSFRAPRGAYYLLR